MALNIGEKVEEFVGIDQNGEEQKLSELISDGSLVVFFYPKADSPLCTKQSCHFRDLESDFKDLNVRVIGVSSDSVGSQLSFAEKNNLTYPLLSDEGDKIAEIFGVKRFGPLPPKRSTFVISSNGLLLGEYKSEISGDGHADWALQQIRDNN